MSHASSDRETTERAEEHYMEEEKEDMADDEVHESKAEAVDATAVVLEWLHRNGMAVKPTGVKVLLSLDDDGLAMVSEIQRALPDLRMPPKAWGPLIKFVQDGVKQHEKEDPVSLDSNALELRNEEFTQPYVNQEIPYRLEACINKCWEQYCAKRPTLSKDAVFPYTTIVQSSGFGKSRLVRELAVLTNKRMPNARMRVLYVCVRQSGSSSGYPTKTHIWPDGLFPTAYPQNDQSLQETLSVLLQTVFHNAMLDWANIGNRCFSHFENATTGKATYEAYTRKLFPSNQQKYAGNRDKPCSSYGSRRVLVLALDEARWLLETSANDRTGWFRRFRRALNHANDAIAQTYGNFAGIFSVLIDTNSKISNFTPPSTRDPSSREPKTGKSMLFPPFVLTHTMDIMLERLLEMKYGERYVKGTLSSSDYCKFLLMPLEETREALASMGRPLWQQYKIRKTGRPGSQDSSDVEWVKLLWLAAEKLVGGVELDTIVKDQSNSLRAVTALLCRLGIRPHSWSPLAPSLVADYMAVLSHMNCTHDQFVGSYSSEPVLTFGAARVWYKSVVMPRSSASQLLEYRLLPELRKMLHQEALDTGEVGEIVARMVLLLAMDATGVVATGNEDERCYDGKFYSVATFLRTLSGDSEDVRIERGEMRDVETLLEPWESWKVGFSHFVKVSQEPTKEALWAMLARRSACILPRNFKGINLLIPIFTPSDNSNEPAVSMIVIQVKNRKGRDAAFPDSATISTRPELTFKGELSKFAIHEVLRIYMSLHGVKRMEQFFTVDPGIRKGPRSIEKEIKAGKIVKTEGPPKPDAVVLCIRGLGGWFAKSLTKGATCMEGDTEVETMELEI
ncbi:hypothetical protein Poli38472_006439 [Pythium oligandrum]|uniref:Uncharacterized protein n=1 Tax=Pythium oligandrum TaxID=41045 RepID=A0A8K1FD28_PYTOL|nr:hypothetical protein Poli38472_006439 [Pythium oligandrum]|eukprot:TMW56429.1 hypothetical protein Poli38472_006439 [Pythium oligandrum]